MVSPTFQKYCLVGFFGAGFLLSSACDPMTATMGAGAAVTGAASEERGVAGIYEDTKIRARINYRWLRHASILMDRLTLSVQNGRVLLTGVVEDAALKKKATELIKDIPGVIELADEVRVGTPETFSDYSRDAWITTKLKAALLFDGQVASRNYSVRTVGRIVYLTGTAQNADELERVINHASSTQGVKNVVSYVKKKISVNPVLINESTADNMVDDFDREYPPEMFEG